MNWTSADDEPGGPPPTHSPLRSFLALVTGIAVAMAGVMLYQALLIMLPMYVRDPEGFERLMELTKSPEQLKAAYQTGQIPTLGPWGLAGTVLMDGLCALAGGWTAAAIARRSKLAHAVALAAMLGAWSAVYAATSELEAVLPAWVPWTRALAAIPLGAALGGYLHTRRGR